MTNFLNKIHFLPLGKDCQLTGYDEASGVWALEKAPGVRSHPNEGEGSVKSKKNLFVADYDFQKEVYSWIGAEGTKRHAYLVHRLDAPTSGIMIVSSSKKMSLKLKKLFADKKVKKTYHAIVSKSYTRRQTLWKDRLFETQQKGKMRVRWGPRGKLAVTDFSHEKKIKHSGLSLVKMKPHTGRTHQLRVQCAKRHIPILGDDTYGDFTLNKKLAKLTKGTLFLHATSVEFEIDLNNSKKTKICFESPLPERFIHLMNDQRR